MIWFWLKPLRLSPLSGGQWGKVLCPRLRPCCAAGALHGWKWGSGVPRLWGLGATDGDTPCKAFAEKQWAPAGTGRTSRCCDCLRSGRSGTSSFRQLPTERRIGNRSIPIFECCFGIAQALRQNPKRTNDVMIRWRGIRHGHRQSHPIWVTAVRGSRTWKRGDVRRTEASTDGAESSALLH